MVNISPFIFAIALAVIKGEINIDHTPNYTRGDPSSYIDKVTFPKVMTDQAYQYRVFVDSRDLGIMPGDVVGSDGSQEVNFVAYNQGYGIPDTANIIVTVIDPSTKQEYMIAQFLPAPQ